MAAAKKRMKVGSGVRSAQKRRATFAAAYVENHHNGTQAAIKAGFSAKTAAQAASRLLNDVNVQALIDAHHAKVLERLNISTERTLRERARMAYYDIGFLATADIKGPQDIAKLPDDFRQAITGWKWDKEGRFVLLFADKNPHLTALEKVQGMYKADNEQQHPQPIEESHSKISDARAIAFILAEGMMLAKKKNAK